MWDDVVRAVALILILAAHSSTCCAFSTIGRLRRRPFAAITRPPTQRKTLNWNDGAPPPAATTTTKRCAFASFSNKRSIVVRLQQQSSSSTNDDANPTPPKTVVHPGMSHSEIENWLRDVPVYAVTDESSDGGGGVVVFNDKKDGGGNAAAFANYYLTKDMANAALIQLKDMNQDGGDDDWTVSPFSLGMIWFELLKGGGGDGTESEVKTTDKSDKGEGVTTSTEVEHRLVPDPRDLGGARKLLSQDTVESQKFQSSYNEVPVFMDLQMRIEEEIDGEKVERFPMYLGLQDMVSTIQQFMRSQEGFGGGGGRGSYDAAINVADLSVLVKQMQEESGVDFRKTLLVPPTMPNNNNNAVGGGENGEEEEEKDSYSPSITSEW